MSRGALAWLPVIGYAGLIFALSSMRGQDLGGGGLWRFDKLIHAVEYAVLAGLLVRALTRARPRASAVKLAALAWALATLYGASDEWHQSFVPGRSSSGWDLVADGVGAALGAALTLVLYRRLRARE
jgi:VanZ family protein